MVVSKHGELEKQFHHCSENLEAKNKFLIVQVLTTNLRRNVNNLAYI